MKGFEEREENMIEIRVIYMRILSFHSLTSCCF